jgi:hypothetical protein
MNRTLTLLQGLPTPNPDLTDIHEVVAWVERAGGDISYITAPRAGYIDGNDTRHSYDQCSHRVHPMTATSWDITTVNPATLCSCVIGYNLAAVPGKKRRVRRVGAYGRLESALARLFEFADSGRRNNTSSTYMLHTCAGSGRYEIAELFPNIAAAARADLDDISNQIGRDAVIDAWPHTCTFWGGSSRVKYLWKLNRSIRRQLADGELSVDDYVDSLDIAAVSSGSDAAAGSCPVASDLYHLVTGFPLPPLVSFADHSTVGDWIVEEIGAQLRHALLRDLNAWVTQVNDFEQMYRNTHILITHEAAVSYSNACGEDGQRHILHLAETAGSSVIAVPTPLAWPLITKLYNSLVGEEMRALPYLHVADKPAAATLHTIGNLVDDGITLADAYACITALDI